jgi:hypothetical protein
MRSSQTKITPEKRKRDPTNSTPDDDESDSMRWIPQETRGGRRITQNKRYEKE